MRNPDSKRTRRSSDQAKVHILGHAQKLLVERGASAVSVRSVARAAGMTDAGVAHHFGSLEGLLEALMNDGALKVRKAIDEAIADWLGSEQDIGRLLETISQLYRNGYAELALQLQEVGWEYRGPVILEPIVKPLMRMNRNPRTSELDIRAALASLHLWLALEPIYGDAFARSAGLRASSGQMSQISWWTAALSNMLKP